MREYGKKVYTPTWDGSKLIDLHYAEDIIPKYFQKESAERAKNAKTKIGDPLQERHYRVNNGLVAGVVPRTGESDVLFANFGNGPKIFFNTDEFKVEDPNVKDDRYFSSITQVLPEDLGEHFPKFPLYAYKHTLNQSTLTQTNLWKNLPVYGTQITKFFNSQLHKTLSNVAIEKSLEMFSINCSSATMAGPCCNSRWGNLTQIHLPLLIST
eukprot:GHVT01040596.1.p1 GENE.GHVT01040596.1~~GHVT01040596.1.p1  ORF type:complete len:211 (-),score=5.84 GHVT01040596.1:744-1376(-)